MKLPLVFKLLFRQFCRSFQFQKEFKGRAWSLPDVLSLLVCRLQLQPQTSTLRATLFCQALGTIRKYIARIGRWSWFVTTVFLSVLPTNSQNIINVEKVVFNLDQNSVMVLINILDKQVKLKCVLMALIPPSDQFKFLGNCPSNPPLCQH